MDHFPPVLLLLGIYFVDPFHKKFHLHANARGWPADQPGPLGLSLIRVLLSDFSSERMPLAVESPLLAPLQAPNGAREI